MRILHFTCGPRWLAALGVLLMLSACAPEYVPPPGYKGGYLWDSDKSRQITVAEGDTIYSIAQRYDVPVKVIIARNALRPPYRLVVGQLLILDPARMHEVASGESISLIARKYGIEYSLIAESNDLRPPYTIYPGQQLWIPDPFTVAAATSGAPPAAGPGATALGPASAWKRCNHRPVRQCRPPSAKSRHRRLQCHRRLQWCHLSTHQHPYHHQHLTFLPWRRRRLSPWRRRSR